MRKFQVSHLFMLTASGEAVPESTLQGILAMTLVTTMSFDDFYATSALQYSCILRLW